MDKAAEMGAAGKVHITEGQGGRVRPPLLKVQLRILDLAPAGWRKLPAHGVAELTHLENFGFL